MSFEPTTLGLWVRDYTIANNHEFDDIIDGNSLGNMDFRNLHKISFNLVYNLSRHQIDPLYEKIASYPMD